MDQDELEGMLVGYALEICNHLEQSESSVHHPKGKMLHLMTPKKLSSIIGGNSKAAVALHKKLRNLIKRQAAHPNRTPGHRPFELRSQQMKTHRSWQK